MGFAQGLGALINALFETGGVLRTRCAIWLKAARQLRRVRRYGSIDYATSAEALVVTSRTERVRRLSG